MNIEFSMPGEQERLRMAYRTKVPGFSVKFVNGPGEFQVEDLSATGFAVMDGQKRFTEGDVFEIRLLIKGKLFLGGAHAKIMRVMNNGVVGISFDNLDRRQQIKVDKLVLEVQKRLIELKKKARQKAK